MSSVTNGKDVLLVDVHSEPSLEDGFSSNESIGLKNGDFPPLSVVEFLQVHMNMEKILPSQWHLWDFCSTFLQLITTFI